MKILHFLCLVVFCLPLLIGCQSETVDLHETSADNAVILADQALAAARLQSDYVRAQSSYVSAFGSYGRALALAEKASPQDACAIARLQRKIEYVRVKIADCQRGITNIDAGYSSVPVTPFGGSANLTCPPASPEPAPTRNPVPTGPVRAVVPPPETSSMPTLAERTVSRDLDTDDLRFSR